MDRFLKLPVIVMSILLLSNLDCTSADCSPVGHSCGSGTSCCENLLCLFGTCVLPCTEEGLTCLSDDTCCSGSFCSAGRCQALSCSPELEACALIGPGSSCCNGLRCVENICRK